jgi:Skp family chaperone for outer membrane proteins
LGDQKEKPVNEKISFTPGNVSVSMCSARPGPDPKIGYVDTDYVFSRLPAARKIEIELNSLEGQMESRVVELNRKYEEFHSCPGKISRT